MAAVKRLLDMNPHYLFGAKQLKNIPDTTSLWLKQLISNITTTIVNHLLKYLKLLLFFLKIKLFNEKAPVFLEL